MQQYKDMIEHVMQNGTVKLDRTGTGTKSVFGYQARYNLAEGFPLLALKETYWKGVAYELLWFLKGDTNIQYLNDNNVGIWNADAKRWQKERGGEYGELGPIYGKQWRSWEGYDDEVIDQIQWVIDEIKRNPDSRRLIVSAWNVAQLNEMALPPCHVLFQFNITNGKLNCQLYQRSADLFLGVPFNIASYALLMHMIAHLTGLEVGEFIHTIGDLHIYMNHIEQSMETLKRSDVPLPTLKIVGDVTNINDFTFDHFVLNDYHPHEKIKGAVSVG